MLYNMFNDVFENIRQKYKNPDGRLMNIKEIKKDISNIFDYGMDGTAQANILGSLIKHLRIGGRIVYLPQMAQYKYDGINIHTHNMTLAHQQTIAPTRGLEMVIFQRTR